MFDLEGFRSATFKPRESEMTLEALKKAGLGDGVITVRGLTAHEIAQSDEASQKGKPKKLKQPLSKLKLKLKLKQRH